MHRNKTRNHTTQPLYTAFTALKINIPDATSMNTLHEHSAQQKSMTSAVKCTDTIIIIIVITRNFPVFVCTWLPSTFHSLILGKWPTWRTNSFLYIYFFIYNSLHVSSTSCSSSGETNCIKTTSSNCHSVLVAVLCAGLESTPNLHTTQPPTQSDSYGRLYWYNFSLLMMSTMCSKHVDSYK